MKRGKLELRKSNGSVQTYFVDSNIFLELQLDQEYADDCEHFLTKVKDGSIKAVTTDFHIDSILVIMENYGKKPSEIRVFLSSLLGYKGLRIYFLSILDRIMATKYMEKFNLDLDDALAYCTMRKFRINAIVSYDKHFDKLEDVVRLEPDQL